MTKKEETPLIWRLSEKPSGDVINRLVQSEVITKDEARTLLFSESDKSIAAQEEEIQFLRALVDKLASKPERQVTIYEKFREYTPAFPIWYRRYEPIMMSYGGSVQGAQTTGIGTNVMSTRIGLQSSSIANQIPQKLSSLN